MCFGWIAFGFSCCLWLDVAGLFVVNGLVVWLWYGVADVGLLVVFVGWSVSWCGCVYCGFLCLWLVVWWICLVVLCMVWWLGHLILVCAVVNCWLCLLVISVVGLILGLFSCCTVWCFGVFGLGFGLILCLDVCACIDCLSFIGAWLCGWMGG